MEPPETTESGSARPRLVPLCQHCLQELPPYAPFCPSCQGPLLPIASWGWMERVWAGAWIYGELIRRKRPSWGLVLATWVFFLPWLGGAIVWFLLADDVGDAGLLGRFFFRLAAFLEAAFAVIPLVLVTRHRLRPERDVDPATPLPDA